MKVTAVLRTAYLNNGESPTLKSGAPTKFRRSETTRVKDAVQALALCHNVTPTYESDTVDSGILFSGT